MVPLDVLAYPGHGAPAPIADLVSAQRSYLTDFRDRVAVACADGQLSAAGRAALVAETERRHRGWVPVAGVPDLIAKNADGIARA